VTNPSLSKEIIEASEKLINKWKENQTSLLDLAQQVNLASVTLRTFGARLEEEYKASIRGKIFNKLS
jgi:hypothetical protein